MAGRDVDRLGDQRAAASPERIAVGVLSHHHGRLLAAPADGSHLAHLIGQCQKRGGAGKQFALKIDPKAITHDRYAKIIDGAPVPEKKMLAWLNRELLRGFQDVLTTVKRPTATSR